MVGPARKREAVGHLQGELELSQRRACKVVGQPRATQRHTPQPDPAEERLRARLQAFSEQRPRAGLPHGLRAVAAGRAARQCEARATIVA